VQISFDDCDVMTQAAILAYDQHREFDEAQFDANLAGAKLAK